MKRCRNCNTVHVTVIKMCDLEPFSEIQSPTYVAIPKYVFSMELDMQSISKGNCS